MLKDLANRSDRGRITANLSDCVVIADDNQELLDAMEHLLSAEGMEVHSASDGLVTLQVCRRLRPRVVVLDLYMPHMSGFEVLTALREDPALRYAYVIVVSGMADGVGELASLAETADRHFIKPLDFDVLITAIEDGLQGGRSRGGLLGRLARR